MNDEWRELLQRGLAWLLMPATLYGAGGGIIKAIRHGKNWKQVILEGTGGVVAANVVGPFIASNSPETWHYTLYFFVGWGGLELVGRIYEAAVSALEHRVQNRINPDGE